MTTVTVAAGICGFKAVIRASSEDQRQVTLAIQSDCPDVTRFGTDLHAVDAFQEIEPRSEAGTIVQSRWPSCLPCTACPVPSGIIKAVEVAAGLALPREATIRFSD